MALKEAKINSIIMPPSVEKYRASFFSTKMKREEEAASIWGPKFQWPPGYEPGRPPPPF